MANELAGDGTGGCYQRTTGAEAVWGFLDAKRAVHAGVVGLMRRPAHGATRRPPLERPGNGFGRPLRARPNPNLRDVKTIERLRSWDPAQLLRGPEVKLDA